MCQRKVKRGGPAGRLAGRQAGRQEDREARWQADRQAGRQAGQGGCLHTGWTCLLLCNIPSIRDERRHLVIVITSTRLFTLELESFGKHSVIDIRQPQKQNKMEIKRQA